MKNVSLLFTLLFAITFTTVLGQAVQKKSMFGTRDAGICFSVGLKVYTGGGSGYKDFWEYVPATDTWVRKNDLPGVKSQRAFGIGLTVNGVAYVGLGADSLGKLMFDLWQYDPANDTWTQKADFPGAAPDGCAFFSVNNKLYVVGGTDNQNVYGSFYEYNPATNSWLALSGATFPGGPVIFATGFSIGNHGYITCGAGQNEFTATYRFDPSDNSWAQVADFPGTVRQTAVAFVIDNMAYVGGGQKGYTQAFNDFYRYNPANDSWTGAGDIGQKGRAWGVATAANGKGYVGTGWDFGASFFNDWWEFTPQNTTGISTITANQPHYYDTESQTWLLFAPEDGQSTIKITDISGKTVLQTGFENATKTLGTQTLNSGIYFIQIDSGTSTWRQKFIVK